MTVSYHSFYQNLRSSALVGQTACTKETFKARSDLEMFTYETFALYTCMNVAVLNIVLELVTNY